MDVRWLISKTRLSPSGTKVVIVREADAIGVVLVDNGEGVHSCRVENLSHTSPVIEEVIIIKNEWELF